MLKKSKYYRYGGYHPVEIGDKIGDYTVERKLGWGYFSTVWLAKKEGDSTSNALKIVKSAKTYTETALDEIKILQKIQEEDPNHKENILHILDHFEHKGPHGTHVCMVTDVGGSNLLDLIKHYDYKGIPIHYTKEISKQILHALDFIHSKCNIIHTDLKPENVLLSFNVNDLSKDITSLVLPPITTKLADFGCANWVNKRFTDDIQTLEYRSPEVILGLHWGCPVDIWSMACLIFELLTGDYLFKPKSGKLHSEEEDHLAQVIELLGFFPSKYLKSAPEFKSMLIYDESKRFTAKQCLGHPWFN
ncbi:non-specific serine/threonine protein kinase [Entamoeba marina]